MVVLNGKNNVKKLSKENNFIFVKDLSNEQYTKVLIDKNLISHVDLINNKLILDAGGRKNSNRGEFNKEKTNYQKWVYSNLDPMTKPDIVGDISKTNFKNEQFDIVLLIEVIEYLNDPSKVFQK